MSRLRTLIAGYIANADARAYTANVIALSVVFNQPFYPLYLWFLAERAALPALLTFLSTPFFAAVPLVTRKSSLAGRALLVGAGAANTFLCAKIFGQQSGVELFLVACALLCLLLFRWNEWRVAGSLLLGMALIWRLMDGRYGLPVREFSAAEYQSMFSLNAISVASLCAFLIILAVRGWWSARKI